MEFPSLWLRGLGVLLIVIGLIGSATGIYALRLVGSYSEQVEPGTLEMETGLTDLTSILKNKKTDFESSIDEASGGLEDASMGIKDAGGEVHSASVSVNMASKNLTTASAELTRSAQLDVEAGAYLKGASEGLKLWADNYEFNGSPLLDKALFKGAVENMSNASEKLEESGAKTKAAAENLGDTAMRLEETAKELEETSNELKDVGEKLDETGTSIGKLKRPIGSLISDVIIPLDNSARSMMLLRDAASNAKNWAYLMLGYFVAIHLVFIGLGIALIVIEVNLSYPM